jgi:hypothetical protein
MKGKSKSGELKPRHIRQSAGKSDRKMKNNG